MRIIHTADWHLGQNLLYQDRSAEQQMALDWLLERIMAEKADALIIAGDVFDISNPPNYARRMYYDFLTALRRTDCRHVLIVGGNHDSPAMLDATRALLGSMDIVVLGAAPCDPKDAIVEWRNADGEIEAVVAAVPFLRDRDLKYGIAGETMAERFQRIQEGIRSHYETMSGLLEDYKEEKVPLLTTGHLYAKGAEASDRQDNIYIGNLENIDPDNFPALFQYVALGHLHRTQPVGGTSHIRYSGSLIPLSFSETRDDKGVVLVVFKGVELEKVQFLQAPVFRRLKTLRCTAGEARERLRDYAERAKGPLRTWVELSLGDEQPPPGFNEELRDFIKEENLDLELVKITLEHSRARDSAWEEQTGDLHTLDDREVFQRRCEEAGYSAEETADLTGSFLELLSWMEEEEAEA